MIFLTKSLLQLRFRYWMALPMALGCCLPATPGLAQERPVSVASAEFTDARYILEPGDELSITVYGYEEYTGMYPVRPDGTITLPVIGTVTASGHTLESLTQELSDQLNVYLVNPSVAVDLSTQRPINVLISGEVYRPGPVQLNLEETSPSLLNAISEVGGITRRADIREITVRRPLPNGEVSTMTLDLWEALWQANDNPDEGEPSPHPIGDLVLRDDDEIIVPQLDPNDESIDRRLVSQSTLAPDVVRVRVVGEVTRPGEIEATPNSSLSSAIAIAGGPTNDAALSRVEFVRLTEEGAIERQEIDLRDLNDEIQVQDGDVVIVPRLDSASVLDWAGRVLSPFSSLLGIIERILRF